MPQMEMITCTRYLPRATSRRTLASARRAWLSSALVLNHQQTGYLSTPLSLMAPIPYTGALAPKKKVRIHPMVYQTSLADPPPV
jgi:hypothetical protein